MSPKENSRIVNVNKWINITNTEAESRTKTTQSSQHIQKILWQNPTFLCDKSLKKLRIKGPHFNIKNYAHQIYRP
jgi:hypothetical protein